MDEAAGSRPQDALITTSLDGRVLGWSRGAQALFGWREREILGRPLAELLHEKHRAVDAQSLADVSGGAIVRDTLVKYVRRDGAVLACLQTMLPLRDAGGRVNGTVRLVFDLSSLQEAERALRRMVAQVREIAQASGADPAGGHGDLGRTLQAERRRTRSAFLDVVGGEAQRLTGLLRELADATHADLAESVQAGAGR